MAPDTADGTGLGEQTNAEWVARLDVPMLLGAAKNLLGAVQSLTGPHPNGYAAACIVQQMGEFLTLHAKPVGQEAEGA